MPTLDWNRRWATKLAGFVPDERNGAHYGDRWGDPEADPALAAIRHRFLTPHLGADTVAVEIGSGGGRWTQFMVACRRLYCVEFNPEMFGYLADRFPGRPSLVFVRTSGVDMPGVPLSGIDFVFSYGVLVHLEAEQLGPYFRTIAAVLRPGGQACLHVANAGKPAGRAKDGFADTDLACITELVAAAGLDLAEVDDETLPHSTMIRAGKPSCPLSSAAPRNA